MLKVGDGLFNFFKKSSQKEILLFSPSKGILIPIADVNDDVFSSKMMGDGYAVQPVNGSIYAPVRGTVESVFPTKHAITFKTKENLEVLLHMGIDTVELNGEPFEILVNAGDSVDENTKVADINLEYLRDNRKATDIMVVLLNQKDLGDFECNSTGDTTNSIRIGRIN